MKRSIMVIVALMSVLPVISSANSWKDLFDIYSSAIYHTESGVALKKQIVAFLASNKFPFIASPEIKGIPIFTTHFFKDEPLVNIQDEEKKFPRVSMMDDPDKPYLSPHHNAGTKHATFVRKSVYEKLKAMTDKLDFFAEVFGYKAGQISIKVFEGLRGLSMQKQLFDNKVKELGMLHSAWDTQQCEQEACKWISPVKDNIPVHSTGAAVDIRLWDNELKNFVDMGPFGVIWEHNPTVATFSEDLTEDQKKNRLFLLICGDQVGLVNYPYEWWHFSSGDRYAAYWTQDDPAKRFGYHQAID